jgi:hypothetical protein
MTSQTTSIYTPFADGRPVRDIVEHTPALVNETWCRNLLRHTLDSLEQQYASGAPHRAITPDTLVMLANGEALLLPSVDEAAVGTPSVAEDLHALALAVHYAITAELPPEGPLGPRLYDNYSEQLTKGLDCCLGPNRRLRPASIDEMRTLLGLASGAGELAAAPQPDLAIPKAIPIAEARPKADFAPQETVAVSFVPPQASDAAPDLVPDVVQAPTQAVAAELAAPVAEAAPFIADETAEALQPGILGARPSVHDGVAPAAEAARFTPEPVNPHDKPMLRKPASQDLPLDGAHPARTAPAPANLHADTGPAPAAPRTPSAPLLGTREAPPSDAPKTWATTDRSSRAQRWGMLAGAAIVVLAAGSALVSYLQQSDTRDVVPLSLPPAEQQAGAPAGADSAMPPPSASTPADPVDAPPAAGAADTAVQGELATDPNLPGSTAAAAPGRLAGNPGDAVVNGTTYKLLIKPWGTVYVDGVDRGVSPPVKRLTLAPGQHTIRIVNPNFPEHTMTVDAGARETMLIEHDFTAKAE